MSVLSYLFFIAGTIGAIDAARRPPSEWIAVDHKKANWIVLMVVFNVFGLVPYVLFIRPKLAQASPTQTAFLKPPQSFRR